MNLGKWSENVHVASKSFIEDWIDDLRKSGSFGKAVQLNFIEETRLSKSLMKKFLKALVKEYERKKSEASIDPDLPLQAIEEAVNSDEDFQGCLKVSKAAPVPGNILLFVSLKTIMRFEYSDAIDTFDANDPPKPIDFNRGLGMGRSGKEGVPYIWVTFPEGAKSFDGMDATAIRDALGMRNVKANDYLYKVDVLSAPVDELRIPTVLDAKGKPPWFPVPRKSPWGITRNLNTDAEEFPELLRESLPSKALAPKGELVCDRNGKASRTIATSENYLMLRIEKFGAKL